MDIVELVESVDRESGSEGGADSDSGFETEAVDRVEAAVASVDSEDSVSAVSSVESAAVSSVEAAYGDSVV